MVGESAPSTALRAVRSRATCPLDPRFAGEDQPLPKRRRGAQPGNRLAFKHGARTRESIATFAAFGAMRARIRAEMRRTLATVAALRAAERNGAANASTTTNGE